METLQKIPGSKLKIHPATVKMRGKIKIVIVEDNEFYNAIIKKQIELLINSIGFSPAFELELLPYLDVNYCVSDIKLQRFKGAFVIAFLDYYLKTGINGLQLTKMIKSVNRFNKVIIFTQSRDFKLWRKLKRSPAEECLYKDESTPFACKYILERLLLKGY